MESTVIVIVTIRPAGYARFLITCSFYLIDVIELKIFCPSVKNIAFSSNIDHDD